MNAAQLIGLAVQVSLALIVFSVALNTRTGDLLWLFHRPGLLLRSMLSMYVVLPVVVALMAAAFSLNVPIEVALFALAVSPVPPILPNKEVKAGASTSYSVALLAVSALVAVVATPLAIWLLGRVTGRDIGISPQAVFRIVAMSVLLPLLAGALVRQFAPSFAARVSRPLSLAAAALLVLAFIPVIVKAWPAMLAHVGNFTLVAIILIVLVGLLVGHLLGGPDPGDRSALALSTAARHPGVAVAVASAIAPDDHSVVAAVLLAFLVSVIATGPYAKWRGRSAAARGASA